MEITTPVESGALRGHGDEDEEEEEAGTRCRVSTQTEGLPLETKCFVFGKETATLCEK